MKAKNPGTRPATDPVDVPVLDSEITPSDIDAYEQLSRIKDEVGEDEGKVVLKRRNSKGQLGALGVMALVDFSIERVIEDWGGGRYVAVIHKNGQKIDQLTFEVDESIPARVPRLIKEETTVPQAPVQVPSAPTADPRLDALERALASTNDLIKTLLATTIARSNGGGEGALGMGLKIAELIAQRTPVSEKPSFADLKDIFLAGLEAREAATGDDGYLGVVKAFSPTIEKLVSVAAQQQQQPRALVASGVAVRPNPAPQPPASAGGSPPLNGPSWLAHLQPHLKMILQWAQEDRNPETYAEVILDAMDPGAIRQVEEAAKEDDFVPKTLAALPMFAPYSAWATAVLTNMKQMLTEEPEPEPGVEATDTGTGEEE